MFNTLDCEGLLTCHANRELRPHKSVSGKRDRPFPKLEPRTSPMRLPSDMGPLPTGDPGVKS